MAPWSKLQTESGAYIVRLDKQPGEDAVEPAFTFLLCDFKSLWNETISSSELFKRVSGKNPELDLNDDVIKEQLIAALGAVASMKEPKVSFNADDVELRLNYLIFGDFEVPFQWTLNKCGPPECFEHFTKLMMQEMREMQHQQKRLVAELKKKDDEIGQYKLECGNVQIRKRFVTEPFDEKAFELKRETFDFEIDEFESVVGALPKNVASDETKAKDESIIAGDQVIQNTTTVTHTSPRGKRPNQRRPPFVCAPLVRAGQIKYDDDDDDDDEDGNGSNIGSDKNGAAETSKRTRCTP